MHEIMKPSRTPDANLKPLIPTSRDEDIMKQIFKYRFTTTQEITRLLFSKGSRTYVRSRLSKLSGGQDYAERNYLYRFPLPSVRGNRERIYTLGSLGRELLASLGQQYPSLFCDSILLSQNAMFGLHY